MHVYELNAHASVLCYSMQDSVNWTCWMSRGIFVDCWTDVFLLQSVAVAALV